jgi:hypothetical protein
MYSPLVDMYSDRGEVKARDLLWTNQQPYEA